MRDLTQMQQQSLERIAATAPHVKVVGWVTGVGPVLRAKHGRLAVLHPTSTVQPIEEVAAHE